MRDVVLTISDADANLSRLRDTLDQLGSELRDKAVTRAVNRTLMAIKAEATRIATQRYTARPKKLFDNVKLRRAVAGNLAGEITIMGHLGVSLIHFQAQPNVPGTRPRGGVTAQVRKAGTRKVYGREGFDRPFIMRKKQGGFGVFVRRHGGEWADYSRGNMQMLFGASPVQALQGREAEERLQDRAAEVFTKRLAHEIDVLIAGIVK